MRPSVLLSLAVVLALLSCGATRPREKHYPIFNEAFFFANNDFSISNAQDYNEVIGNIARVLCEFDRVTDESPEAWKTAAAQCNDSEVNADAEPISSDGAWHEYIAQAYATITQMCKANSGKLCESFR